MKKISKKEQLRVINDLQWGSRLYEREAIQQFKRRLAKAEKALRFYADESRYEETPLLGFEIIADKGNKAREALNGK